MTHKGTVLLETERLILRRFVPEDIRQIFNNCWSDYNVWKWTNYAPMNSIEEKVIDFFFCEVGFNRIYAYHASENPASGKVMQKCGMLYEGTLRQAGVSNNGIHDEVLYAILAEDYFRN